MPNTQPTQPTARRTITDDIRDIREGQAALVTPAEAERQLDRLRSLIESDCFCAPEARHLIQNEAAQCLNTLGRYFGLLGES